MEKKTFWELINNTLSLKTAKKKHVFLLNELSELKLIDIVHFHAVLEDIKVNVMDNVDIIVLLQDKGYSFDEEEDINFISWLVMNGKEFFDDIMFNSSLSKLLPEREGFPSNMNFLMKLSQEAYNKKRQRVLENNSNIDADDENSLLLLVKEDFLEVYKKLKNENL